MSPQVKRPSTATCRTRPLEARSQLALLYPLDTQFSSCLFKRKPLANGRRAHHATRSPRPNNMARQAKIDGSHGNEDIRKNRWRFDKARSDATQHTLGAID